MNRKNLAKLFFTAAIAFFAAGGACYEMPRPVLNEQVNADDVFTSYRIEEFTAENGGCRRRFGKRFFVGDAAYELQPPARATYNGKDISVDSVECDGDKAEFVFTDAQGRKKNDIYELKKVKFDFPLRIDRASDLRIPLSFDDAFTYDFSGSIQPAPAEDESVFFRVFQVKDETDLVDRLQNPQMETDLAYFLSAEKMLVIPRKLFSKFRENEIKLGIGVEQSVFKPKTKNPESSLKSQALIYKYAADLKIRLN